MKNIINAVKIAGGCIAAIFIANLLKLNYSASAGIITILSIQATKKETLRIALKRLLAFLSAVVIAFGAFSLLGYTLSGFALYMFVYIFVCMIFHWQAAMAVNSVLVTHFWTARSMSPEWILNELLIFLIGVSVGVIINLSLHARRDKINALKLNIEEDIRNILARMSNEILIEDKSNYKGNCFEVLDGHISEAIRVTEESISNSFHSDVNEELLYIMMRKNQAEVLRHIYENVLLLDKVPRQSHIVAEFIGKLSNHIFMENDVNVNLEELHNIFENMKDEPLPSSRKEFENRAILYQILYQLEEFLSIKYEWSE